ncbi:MAG: metallophosphoesterase [Gordonia sp. (in: high G+C Gram-positive bacteria)]|uniref:metallophosphoesterase n=1 Tax=Gordonia sp. (in: high G+C Gram-positive bacteria) TaxID=84139 RepID=UPI003BB7324E
MYWIVGAAATLVVVAITYFLHRRLVVATGLPRGWARAADAVLVIGMILGVSAFLVGVGVLNPSWARPIGFIGYTWWAVVFYLLLWSLLIGLIALIVRLIARVSRRQYTSRWLPIATVIGVVAAVVTVGYGLTEANRVQVTDETAVIEQLPAPFEGLRIALVTDLHVGPARGAGFTRRVVEQVNEAKPDLVILGGDLADGTVAEVGPDLDPLRELTAPMGVFGVSGNHEYIADDAGSWLDYWETLGITPLRNERVQLHRDGATIDLVGVYDSTAPAPYEPDPDRAFAGTDPNDVILYIAHQPRQADDVQGRGVDLQLSGHTHDGQLWPFGYAVRLQQPVVSGFGDVGDVRVFTSRGTGAWGPPVRVAAPPQIVLLTLTSTG